MFVLCIKENSRMNKDHLKKCTVLNTEKCENILGCGR
jgi:hypothetical protein